MNQPRAQHRRRYHISVLVLGAIAVGTSASHARGGITYSTLDDPNASPTVVQAASGVSGDTVVGYYYFWHGFSSTNGSFLPIDVPGPSTYTTKALGISGDTVVGVYYPDILRQPMTAHGFMEKDGSYTTIDMPGATGTQTTGIASNTVIGWFWDATGNHGFSETDGVFTTLDVPGTTYTVANGISGDTVVGTYQVGTGRSHGFIEAGGVYTTLDVPGALGSTFVTGISGESVIGYYTDQANGSGLSHGFIETNGAFVTLDVPGAASTQVLGVSGHTVVGMCSFYDNGWQYHGFIAIVPEPASAALLAVAADITLCRRVARLV